MAVLNAVYVSAGVPFGGLTGVTIYRPTAPLTPGTAPTTLATNYVIESVTPTNNTIMGKRPAADGGDNGWWMVAGTIEGSAVMQIPSGTSPTPVGGEFFVVTTDVNGQNVEVDSAGAQVSRRFVIHSPAESVSTTEYRKISCSVIVDKFLS